MINQFLPCNMPLDLASLVTPWDNLVVDNPFFYIPLSKYPTEKLMFIINETSSRPYLSKSINVSKFPKSPTLQVQIVHLLNPHGGM